MAYISEDIRLASELFFHLLNNRILPLNDILASEYGDNNQVREIVNTMAREAGLHVFGTRENLHLVSEKENSIFATTYTQMKEKFNRLNRKKHFHLANIIISIYLAEIDRESNFNFRIEDASISYYKLEEVITETLDTWKKRNEEEDFSEDFAIAIDEIHHLWTVEMSHSRPRKDGTGFSLSSQTRLGFINQALKPLEYENLIINLHRESKIIPKNELYERLDYLYHGGDRFDEIMELIKITREEQNNA
ncbi:MAG TPA: DUF6063 family protein [Tissierellaceae bacterium]|nr:DUF6063 family protein [Tissierellaceae bacterium]